MTFSRRVFNIASSINDGVEIIVITSLLRVVIITCYFIPVVLNIVSIANLGAILILKGTETLPGRNGGRWDQRDGMAALATPIRFDTLLSFHCTAVLWCYEMMKILIN